MVKSCAARCCQNRFGKNSEIRFHKFPVDPLLRRRWLLALPRDSYAPFYYDVICSEHFEPSDHKDDPLLELRRLKPGAVPIIFMGFPPHLQQRRDGQVKKRRVLPDRHPPTSAMTLMSCETSSSPVEMPDPVEIVQKDHPYAFPSTLEKAEEKCDKFQDLLLSKVSKEKKRKAD